MDMVVKPVLENDLKEMSEWLKRNVEKNGLDPKVFTYPSLECLKAVRGGDVIAYLPVHPVIQVESLAPRPMAKKEDIAMALKQILVVVGFNAFQKGMRELFFIGSDKETSEFAERHGFEKIELPVYRLKL